MPGLVPGIHVFSGRARKTWMAGTSPAMTRKVSHFQACAQFLAVSFSLALALQEIKNVNARAVRAMSAVFNSVLASEI